MKARARVVCAIEIYVTGDNWNEHTDIGWDEIAGADEAKGELLEIVEFLRDPERFERLGAHVPKGILLHGPPGRKRW